MAAWLSWVLLVGFVVTISVFIYGWMIAQTNKSIEQMKTVVEDSAECDSVAIYISGICQEAQKINLNITNADALPVDGLIFRAYDLSLQPDVRDRNVTIRPQSTKELSVLKQGIIKKLELIPVTNSGTKRVICRKKMIFEENIVQCS